MEGQIAGVAGEFWLRIAQRRGFKTWRRSVADGLRKAHNKRLAAKAFLNRALKKGWNGWVALMFERATALARLRAAGAGGVPG